MNRYMSTHTFPAGAYTYDQVCQLADAAQRERNIRGYRSFLNLTEGKIWCVMEAESEGAVVAWFEKMGIEHDGIWPVEIEGDCGTMTDLRPKTAMAGMSSR